MCESHADSKVTRLSTGDWVHITMLDHFQPENRLCGSETHPPECTIACVPRSMFMNRPAHDSDTVRDSALSRAPRETHDLGGPG